VDLPIRGEFYIPRITWTQQPSVEKGKEPVSANVVALTLNRDQTKMAVYTANPKSTVAQPFYSEESKECYVDYDLFNQWQWLSDGRVIVVSEKGGYTQAYLYSSQGMEQKLLTPEQRDVTAVYGYDEKAQVLYYQAAVTPMTRQAFALNEKKGITTQLTQGEGTHALRFSKDWKQYIDCYQSVSLPNRYTLWEVKSDKLEAKGTVLDNDSVLQAWKASGLPNKEFFSLTTERGDVLNGWQIKPLGFDATKKYPVVMMQYSGPASQRVTDTWRKRFGHYLAAQGYLVVCVDGRGTNARGREWRNATYMQLGVKEAEDQISTAKYLKSLPYVDANRMALCGWSYGGYQTLVCMSKQGNTAIWQCGIAIAPVTSWRLYDSAYTERYMRRPQVNSAGYEKADVMNLAKDLTGNLLLVHGLADDNVHVQHSWLYVDALVQAGKQFEMQMYVDDNHSIRKTANKEHLHKRILLFLEKNL
jgi:dipeptidyl-peptidase-4